MLWTTTIPWVALPLWTAARLGLLHAICNRWMRHTGGSDNERQESQCPSPASPASRPPRRS